MIRSIKIGIFFIFCLVIVVFSLQSQSFSGNPVWQITRGEIFYDYSPYWEKSGEWIYYLSNLNQETGLTAEFNLYRVDSNGFREPLLIPVPGYELYDKIDFAFFSEETKIAFTLTKEAMTSEIYLADVNGVSYGAPMISNIIALPGGNFEKRYPAGNKAGNLLFFTAIYPHKKEIWSYDLSTSIMTREISNAQMPFFSPDDKYFIYISATDGQIYRRQLGGTSSQKISDVSGVSFTFPKYSFSGDYIISSTTDGKIYYFPMFTTEAEPTLTFPRSEKKLFFADSIPLYHPSFSPSGAMLVFNIKESDISSHLGKVSSILSVKEISSDDKILEFYRGESGILYFLEDKSGIKEIYKLTDVFNFTTRSIFSSETGIYSFSLDENDRNLVYLKKSYYGNDLWREDLIAGGEWKLSPSDRRIFGGGFFSKEAYYFKFEGNVVIYKRDQYGGNEMVWGELDSKYNSIFDYYFLPTKGVFIFSVRDESKYERLVYYDLKNRTFDYIFKDDVPTLNLMPSSDSEFKRVLFISGRHGGMNIWLYDRDNSKLLKLTQGSFKDEYPVFGKKRGIIFVREYKGKQYLLYNTLKEDYVFLLKKEFFQGNGEDLKKVIESQIFRHSQRNFQLKNYKNYYLFP